MIKVGIPRALLYYQYYPMWKTFFKELGAEVVVSPPTNQAMLSEGSSGVVADTCLPVKAFLGHVLSIKNECDYIFIPAIRSTRRKVYNCAKFLGLPDITKAVIPECPPTLDIDIDINKGKHKLYQAIYQLGRHFTWNPFKIRRAYLAAHQVHLDYQQLMTRQTLTPVKAIDKVCDKHGDDLDIPCDNVDFRQNTIAIIGHPYLLYDEYLNHRLIQRLEQANTLLLTPEMLTVDEREEATIRLAGEAHWTYEDEVVGAGGHYLQSSVDGVIGIMAFGCGPDSLMMDVVRRQAARLKSTPFMCLTIEEHTAEAGIITRLEAFLDMIQLRKRRKVSICV